MNIDKHSVMSIFISTHSLSALLMTATGIVAKRGARLFLLTNRHVVTGLQQATNETLSNTMAVPSKLSVWVPRSEFAGRLEWVCATIPLVDEDQKRLWHEHPNWGSKVDVVAIEIPFDEKTSQFAYDVEGEVSTKLGPAEVVSVIGYPFGLPAGGRNSMGLPNDGFFAIWCTGFVASEPSIDHDGMPCFLIDCRTRSGQSGSAVVFSRESGFVPREDGSMVMYQGRYTELVGLYSGRINRESDIGIVWKRRLLEELVMSAP